MMFRFSDLYQVELKKKHLGTLEKLSDVIELVVYPNNIS